MPCQLQLSPDKGNKQLCRLISMTHLLVIVIGSSERETCSGSERVS
jgi:hypothetical protein